MKRSSILIRNSSSSFIRSPHRHSRSTNTRCPSTPWAAVCPCSARSPPPPRSPTGAGLRRATWSTGAVPAAGAKVLDPGGPPGHLRRGERRDRAVRRGPRPDGVRPDRNTKLKIVNLLVMDDGLLEVGTAADRSPRARARKSRSRISRSTRSLDPGQVGNGIVGLGRISMHGAAKTPTFARLAGDARVVADDVRAGSSRCRAGRRATGSSSPTPDSCAKRAWARLQVARRAGRSRRPSTARRVTVRPALAVGPSRRARQQGRQSLQPHVGNLSRNVVVAPNARGTRGHMIFLARADVDLRYVEVRDMGRTMLEPIDSTTFDDEGTIAAGGHEPDRPLRDPLPPHLRPGDAAGQRLSVHAHRQRRDRPGQVGHHDSQHATTAWSRTTSSTTRTAPRS